MFEYFFVCSSKIDCSINNNIKILCWLGYKNIPIMVSQIADSSKYRNTEY